MKPAAWITVAVAAMVASVAWRFARRSKLALAIAVVATSLAVLGLTYAAAGWGGCTHRGDCGSVGGTLRVILGIETLLLPVLLLAAGVRWLWRRFVPEREPKGDRPHTRGDAPRMRPRDIGLALGGVVFGLFSLLLIAGGHGAERMAGVATLLFSAAVLIVPLSGRIAARTGAPPRLDRIDGEPALVIPGSQAKMRLMRLGALLFGCAALTMALWPDGFASTTRSSSSVQLVGIVGAVVFGAMALLGTVFARGPARIELLPSGLRWRIGARPCRAEWDAITAVWPFQIDNTWFLGVNARPDGLHVPKGQRRLARANRSIAHADASISLEPFPIEPERLADVVGAYARDATRRRELGTDTSLRALEEGLPEAAHVGV
jgi:hypothetical protein